MTDVNQTYPVSIPSLGLARMCYLLADSRNGPGTVGGNGCFGPVSRTETERERRVYPASREYYRIIDRIAAGEQP